MTVEKLGMLDHKEKWGQPGPPGRVDDTRLAFLEMEV